MVAESRTEFGGQAVLGGVLMRSSRYLVVSIRRSDGLIQLSCRENGGEASRIFSKPIFRGTATFFSLIFQGMDALFFSADPQSDPNAGKDPSTVSSLTTVFAALLLAFAGFVLLPRMIAISVGSWGWVGFEGVTRAAVFVGFVSLMSALSPFRSWFQHSRAVSRVVGAFEAGESLALKEVRECKTEARFSSQAFLLTAMFVLLLFFGTVEPGLAMLDRLPRVGLKLVLWIGIVGGVYEVLLRTPRLCARVLKIFSREPTTPQLEVALAALKQAIRLERGQQDATPGNQFSVRGADELALPAPGRKPA